MTIYGRKITDEDMKNIATYMDDEIREELHSKLAPCSHEEFIDAYLDKVKFDCDDDFEEILYNEFDFDPDGEEKKHEVIWIGGERDGETLGTFETFREAELFANLQQEEHKDEFDPVCGGIGIIDPDGGLVEW